MITEEGSSLGVPGLRWGIAKCHENDTYCKRTGRIKATGKSFSKESFATGLIPAAKAKILAEKIAIILHQNEESIPDAVELESCLDMISEAD
jgi:hypothetical protein